MLLVAYDPCWRGMAKGEPSRERVGYCFGGLGALHHGVVADPQLPAACS